MRSIAYWLIERSSRPWWPEWLRFGASSRARLYRWHNRSVSLHPLILLLALAACSDSERPVAHARAKNIAPAFTQEPVVQRYKIDGNDLLVIDIPSKNPAGFAESQRCFVWRDTQFNSATMTCPHEADYIPAEHFPER